MTIAIDFDGTCVTHAYPRGDYDYVYLPASPSVIISDIFGQDAKFDILLNDEEIYAGINLTNTCPEMEPIVNQVLKQITQNFNE